MKAIESSFCCGNNRFQITLLALAGACCLFSGCITGPPSQVQIQAPNTVAGSEDQFERPTSVRVTTFNVWGLPSWLNGASSSRYARIARELNEIGSDVVLLQEVWTRRCFADLSEACDRLNRPWWAAAARHKGTFLGQNGLLTLSKYPIASAEVKYFSRAHLPDSLMNKGALKVTIVVGPGKRINVWNVHLQDGGSRELRSRQLLELIRWIDNSHDLQIADVVGGDFNFTPDSKEFRAFESAIGPDVHRLANDQPFPTWDGLKLSPELGQTLDHIFVRLKQRGNEVSARPRKVFAASQFKDRLSDHMGMEALLTFRNDMEQAIPVLVGQGTENNGRVAVLTTPFREAVPFQ